MRHPRQVAGLVVCFAAAVVPIPRGPDPGSGPESVWTELASGNRRFITGKSRSRDLVGQREALRAGQHPRAVVLTCSDSRVSPELLFDQGLGDLFVVRTAGNVADEAGLGSIEYAIDHLHASLLVVLGHRGCGAVGASASGAHFESPHMAALITLVAPEVERNAVRSATTIANRSDIVKNALAGGRLSIVPAVYELETGEVRRLP